MNNHFAILEFMRKRTNLLKKISILAVILLLFVTSFTFAEEKLTLFDSPVNSKNYLLRPGDELLVTFIHSQIKPLTLTIDPEGKIVHETIGLFQLQNKTLEYAKTELIKTLKELYNVDNIEISIKAPRPVTISVFGSVKNPGMYQGMTSDRVSDIIKKAGGIRRIGSSRNIKFYGGDNSFDVDLDKAKYLGDFNSNPYLYAGTKIEVPSKSSNTVHVSGDVNFPREIELKDGDDLSLLIQLVGKFKNSATISDVKIIRGNQAIDYINLQAGDIIMVKSKHSNDNNVVKLFGGIVNQGLYSFNEGMTIDELIFQAGGYTLTANKNLTTIFRQPIVDIQGGDSHIRYPISKPNQLEDSQAFTLKKNDSIFVPLQVGFIKISGAVMNPGYFPYQTQKEILFYIKSAGGFLPTSNKDEIKLFNPISAKTMIVSSGVLVPDGAEIIIQIKEELK